jgi:hypothetical protein
MASCNTASENQVLVFPEKLGITLDMLISTDSDILGHNVERVPVITPGD